MFREFVTDLHKRGGDKGQKQILTIKKNLQTSLSNHFRRPRPHKKHPSET